jgi:hypothetical protein
MTLSELYAKRDALRRAAEESTASALEAEAEIAIAEKDPLRAEWKRLEAEVIRESLRTVNYSPDCRAAAHRAFIIHMAHMHLRDGTVPTEGDHMAREIEEEMDRQLLSDRPSHSTAVPEFEASPDAASTATTNHHHTGV